MNGANILISFDLPTRYLKKIEDVSAHLKVQQSHDEKQLLNLIKDADILLAGFLSREMFRAAQKLKWIQSVGAGVDRYLFPEVVKSQVTITNASGVHPIPISEHVIGMMLCFCRKLHFFIRSQMEGKWRRDEGRLGEEEIEELSDKTVGIFGLGRIGDELAKKAKCLGMRVIATRKNPYAPAPDYVDKLIQPRNLEELLTESDFVVLTLPLTTETRGIIGEEQFRSMKKTSYLINVGRGKLVQEDKLIKALNEGWIAGAGLDTFEMEPLPRDSDLWRMHNVIITPHIAGATPHYLERLTDIFCENLERFLRNEKLINVVNKTLGY